MEKATQTSLDCYSFLSDSKPEAGTLSKIALEDMAKVLDQAAVGFLDSNFVLRATLAGYLDTTPPEEIEPGCLARASHFHGELSERVLMHPRVRAAEGMGRELEALRDKADEVIARDIAAYGVSYASLEARRLVPFLREYRASLDSLSTGLSQFKNAEHVPLHRALYSSALKLVQYFDEVTNLLERDLPNQHLVTAALYEFLERSTQEPSRTSRIIVFSTEPAISESINACIRLVRDADFMGKQHRLVTLCNGLTSSRIQVIGFHEKARRFGPLYDTTYPYTETLTQHLQRLPGDASRETASAYLREAVQGLIEEHERSFRESVIPTATINPAPESIFSDPNPKPIQPILTPIPSEVGSNVKPIEETRLTMETIETINVASTTPAAETTATANASIAPSAMSPTLDNLPPTDELMAQTLRRLYRNCYTNLAQVRQDVERLGEKLLNDEGTRRIAERCGDEAFANALNDEVKQSREVVEGKLALLQTQKAELLQKKAALNAEIEALRGSVVIVANAVEREMDLLRRDAELGRQLSDVLSKLRAFSPLADSLARITGGAGFSPVPSAEGTFRLGQLVEELGEAPHNVSALIKQLRDKGILPPQQHRGIYTAQERQIIVDMHRSKSVSEISREWGNAVTTIKQIIIERLIEGRDYYNLGKGSERDSFRVTPLGQDKLRKALSMTRAGQRG